MLAACTSSLLSPLRQGKGDKNKNVDGGKGEGGEGGVWAYSSEGQEDETDSFKFAVDGTSSSAIQYH